jgi:hypothetical protein
VFKVWDGSAWRSEAGQFVIAATGTAAAPSITFTGDTNTGLYSPGADQVAISTNGTGRLFVDANGKVGIGTSAQQYTVHAEAANPRIVAVSTSATSYAGCESRTSDGSSVVLLKRGAAATGTTLGQSNANGAQLYSVSADYFGIGTFQSNPLIFGTNNTERLRITSDGNLGLGTSSPQKLCEISQSSGTVYDSTNINGLSHELRLANTNTTLNTATSLQFVGAGSAISAISSVYTGSSSSALTFATRGGSSATPERMRIDSSGRVGIGTTSPTSPLHVNANSATEVDTLRLQATNGGDNQRLDISIDATANTVIYDATGSSAGAHIWQRGGTESARIDSSGRLLVGTDFTSATGTIFAQGSSSSTTGPSYLYLQRGQAAGASIGNGTSIGVVNFADNASGVFAQIAAEGDAPSSSGDYPGRLVFSTTADGASSPTERMRISADGTTSLLGDLDIDGSYRSNIVAVAALDIDCSAGNYFTKTISSNSTFTFSNATSSRAISFTLELTHTSGTVTWPASVKWPSDTAPTLTTGKTHLFMFVTDDGGTRWRGAALVDYVN